MNTEQEVIRFFVGWDVGAWNCDKNPNSRDAIVILDSQNQIVGRPWGWGNLRSTINASASTRKWLEALFTLCDTELPKDNYRVTMAIDTPLGFSTEFVQLITNLACYSKPIDDSATNKYLFRQTERFLFANDHTPLSAIIHMIGSQATKGVHVISKFSKTIADCGVWTDGASLTVIEAYPASCKGSKSMRDLRHHAALGRDDIEDALTCALVAYLFETNRASLAAPFEETPKTEGWIWVPLDALNQKIDPASVK